MSEPPELWTFAAANLLTFAFGAILTGLSYLAYRSSGRTETFRNAALGFGLVTVGGAAEPVYQLLLKGDYHLGGRELLAVQTVEGALIGLGLGLLFYSIYRHGRRTGRAETAAGERFLDP